MNVDTWLRAAWNILRLLMGNPAGHMEFYTALVSSFLILVTVLSAAGKALGLAQANRITSSMVALLGGTLILLSMTAASLYLPQWNNIGWRVWILVASGSLAWVLVVVPLTCWIKKGGYLAALVAWGLAGLAAALVVILVGAVFDGLSAGSRSALRGKQHKEQIERALE